MTPFADDSASITVAGLTVENGTDRIALYGTADITRDRAGLAQAEALAKLLAEVVAALKADPHLPAAVPPPAKPSTVRNPFS